MNRAVLHAVLLPVLVTVVLTVAFLLFVDSHEVVLHDFNDSMGRELQATSTVSGVGVLLAVDTLHVYVCMPHHENPQARAVRHPCSMLLLMLATAFASISRCTSSVVLFRARVSSTSRAQLHVRRQLW